jgi:ABC-type dipeptide/oligopeptide/nickel transport system permease subunit
LSGLIGGGTLLVVLLACLLSLPWTLASVSEGASAVPRYNEGDTKAARLPPFWASKDVDTRLRLNRLVDAVDVEKIAEHAGVDADAAVLTIEGTVYNALARHHPRYLLGTDRLGRSVLVRALTGGGISLLIGIAAAVISVGIGTVYGAVAGYAGGKVDAVLMRFVDVLYGLPYILLVVLLAVASDAVIDEYISRSGERGRAIERMIADAADAASGAVTADVRSTIEAEALVLVPPRRVSPATRTGFDVLTLLVAIGGVSWLTMARVVRGEVLSLKSRPFVEASRASGAGPVWIFRKHLLPNLLGPVLVYGTLTVPQAILQESFLSFLGIGVKPPLPSWGTMAADGLDEVNTYRSHWWLLAVPSVLLAVTLLSLNFVGEAWRDAVDPKRRGR